MTVSSSLLGWALEITLSIPFMKLAVFQELEKTRYAIDPTTSADLCVLDRLPMKLLEGRKKLLVGCRKLLVGPRKLLAGRRKLVVGHRKLWDGHRCLFKRYRKVLEGRSKVKSVADPRKLWDDHRNLFEGHRKVLKGRRKVLEGLMKVLDSGMKVLKGHSKQLKGRSKLREGHRKVLAGRRKLLEGRRKLLEGCRKLGPDSWGMVRPASGSGQASYGLFTPAGLCPACVWIGQALPAWAHPSSATSSSLGPTSSRLDLTSSWLGRTSSWLGLGFRCSEARSNLDHGLVDLAQLGVRASWGLVRPCPGLIQPPPGLVRPSRRWAHSPGLVRPHSAWSGLLDLGPTSSRLGPISSQLGRASGLVRLVTQLGFDLARLDSTSPGLCPTSWLSSVKPLLLRHSPTLGRPPPGGPTSLRTWSELVLVRPRPGLVRPASTWSDLLLACLARPPPSLVRPPPRLVCTVGLVRPHSERSDLGPELIQASPAVGPLPGLVDLPGLVRPHCSGGLPPDLVRPRPAVGSSQLVRPASAWFDLVRVDQTSPTWFDLLRLGPSSSGLIGLSPAWSRPRGLGSTSRPPPAGRTRRRARHLSGLGHRHGRPALGLRPDLVWRGSTCVTVWSRPPHGLADLFLSWWDPPPAWLYTSRAWVRPRPDSRPCPGLGLVEPRHGSATISGLSPTSMLPSQAHLLQLVRAWSRLVPPRHSSGPASGLSATSCRFGQGVPRLGPTSSGFGRISSDGPTPPPGSSTSSGASSESVRPRPAWSDPSRSQPHLAVLHLLPWFDLGLALSASSGLVDLRPRRVRDLVTRYVDLVTAWWTSPGIECDRCSEYGLVRAVRTITAVGTPLAVEPRPAVRPRGFGRSLLGLVGPPRAWSDIVFSWQTSSRLCRGLVRLSQDLRHGLVGPPTALSGWSRLCGPPRGSATSFWLGPTSSLLECELPAAVRPPGCGGSPSLVRPPAVRPPPGLVRPPPGLVRPPPGLVRPRPSLVQPPSGLVRPARGFVRPRPGLARPLLSLVQPPPRLVRPCLS
ncbi:hypothetical protein FNV43_RR16113 [Rhamnella rubrinervis]|uniref:Uncharacterized protein n=1 Tax=Rhamnella rubrinervis TaxID=2594499 RepID=A0A8K0GUW7_9ROSA|nr:hypothetical protein FNV43_RR16113 [Rhamnella rubrinervis]